MHLGKIRRHWMLSIVASFPYVLKSPREVHQVCFASVVQDWSVAYGGFFLAEARKRILHDLEAFVDSVTDWFRRDDGSMPTVAEHYANRDLNAGVRPTIALIEYCYGLDIPSSIMEHESLQEIKERATEIVMIANDLASIRPEIVCIPFEIVATDSGELTPITKRQKEGLETLSLFSLTTKA
ncbi:hypothetical protein FN846DRAFT_1013503 [Sphaerosporella brunnea]|uniref:Isoprenoid synthase domain-containing protein n=1 Tax=Sphaerosporella brunnea TaxID=1250544 RepID=A0A5J5EX86_9PEZI|nr:hypothetical protein FN846DRAFT_1013503 [Sphaerosporella brunnea]